MLPLNSLCEPRNTRVASIMGDVVVRSSRELLRSGLVSRKGRGRLTFRNVPSFQEFEKFLSERIDRFPRERKLTANERREFHKLEKDLAVLASSTPQLKEYLGELAEVYSVALTRIHRRTPMDGVRKAEGG